MIIKTYLNNVVSMAKKQNPIIVVELLRDNHTYNKKEIFKLRNNIIYQPIRKSRILFYIMFL